MSDNSKILEDYENNVRKQYLVLGLKELTDIDFDNKNGLQYYIDILKNKQPLREFDDLTLFADIRLIFQDIMYFIATLNLYYPYLNNPLEEGKTYFQNFADRRYLMFSSIIVEKIYNYWDRIGDLLDYYFMTNLETTKVFFITTLNNFPVEFQKSSNFIWLKNFKDNEYKELNVKRKNVVHYQQLGSKHFSGFFANYEDDNKLAMHQEEKEEYVDYFIKHYVLCISGYEKALKLIDELPNK